ncbi:MAG: sugar ABC transporter permease, partial [Candidatus Caldarchaeum sp.]|nr:sugar ABC transporter permease [Candidatus Caldarchaeum sp.]
MKLSSILLFTPAFVLAAITILYPLAVSLYISLHEISPLGWTFVGLKHYAEMLTNFYFYQSLAISVVYTLMSVLAALSLGLFTALLVRQLGRGRGFAEGFFAVPLAVSPILVGIVWSPPAVWDDLNALLHYAFSLPFIDVTDPVIYFPVMVLSEAWVWSPLFMLAVMVVLDSLPKDCLEAAELTGASRLQMLSLVYLPAVLRSRVIAMLVALKAVDFFRSFEVPFAWSFWVRETQLGAATDTLS